MGYTFGNDSMKTFRENIVADGFSRIRDSTAFSQKTEEIKKQLMDSRRSEIDTANRFRRWLILWKIHQASTRRAREELCPPEALY